MVSEADRTPERQYVVLGDVVDSREIEDREAFRERFAAARETITDAYGADLVAGPTVLKGIDELGAVLSSLERIYDIVVALQDQLHPRAIRLTVAGGEIEFGADREDVSRMDGEAFHRATALLASIERDGLRFDLDADGGPIDTAIADEVNLLLHLRDSWTDRQREVVELYGRFGNQRAVADELGVSQQAVSNVLQGASWPLVETIEGRLRETLRAYDEYRGRVDR